MIRAGFIMVILLVLPTGWAQAQETWRPTPEQKAAIEALSRPGLSFQCYSPSQPPRICVRKETRYKRLTEPEAALLDKLPEFHTLRIESPDALDEWLALAERISGIRELDINLPMNAKLTPSQLDAIVGLTRIQKLELWDCGLSDSDVERFTTLKDLRELRIGWARLTSAAFAAVARLPELRSLVVFGNRGPESGTLAPGWDALAKLEHLESVKLTRLNVRPPRVSGVESLRSLRTLAMDISEFDDQVVESLTRIPNLQHLTLIFPRISGRGLAGLRDARNLKTVRIRCYQDISASDVAFLLEYTDPEVRGLDFKTALSLGELVDLLPGPVRGLAVVGRDSRFGGASAPCRMTINLKGRAVKTELDLTDDDMKIVGRLRDMETLSLIRYPDTKDAISATCDGLRQLEGLPKLRRVTLDLRTPLDGASLAVLGTLPSLGNVTLRGVALDADGLRWLRSAKNVEVVDIDCGLIHGDALASLRSSPPLNHLSLRNVRLAPPRLRRLAGAPIKGLLLEHCGVTDADCADIAKCVALESLSIDGALLTDSGIASLYALSNLKSLRVQTSGRITLGGFRRLVPLTRLRYVDAVGKGGERLGDERMADELGWTFRGECSCGCMDYTRPRVCNVTKDQIHDGAVVIDANDPDLKSQATNGLRFRGPMKLERLTLRADDFPFTVRQIHFNDCDIEELILIGIVPSQIVCWGDARIKRLSQRDPGGTR